MPILNSQKCIVCTTADKLDLKDRTAVCKVLICTCDSNNNKDSAPTLEA
jgi:hypothetical protein